MPRSSQRLRHDFPAESFLLVRFGDHQLDFAERIIDPSLSQQRRPSVRR